MRGFAWLLKTEVNFGELALLIVKCLLQPLLTHQLQLGEQRFDDFRFILLALGCQIDVDIKTTLVIEIYTYPSA